MQRLYLPKFIVLSVLLYIATSTIRAQKLEYLDANNVKAGIGIGGNLFTTTTPTATWDLFETPAGSNRREIYTAGLWMTGLDSGANLHCAANRYYDYGRDFFDGPIAGSYNANYDNYYKRVFRIDQNQIYNFTGLHFPVNASQVDSAIKYWPAKGNACVLNDFGVSINSELAPFVDLNNNGIYEPLLGEYPAVLGGVNIFFVFNDARQIHSESNGEPLNVEIRGLASSFLDDNYNLPSYNSPLNNAIYVQYEIQNKSNTAYTNFELGLFVDPDLGCFQNDYVGCDTNRNMMFAYNGTDSDPDCAPEIGYQLTHVALGVQMLNKNMGTFGYFASSGGGNSQPLTAGVYAGFLQGFWGDGTPFEFGGSGYNTGAPTKFCFPSAPTDTTGWSEAAIHTTPGDRQMFFAAIPSSFAPGEVKHFDLSFTTAYNDGSDKYSIVDSLKKSVDIVSSFYNNAIIPGQQILEVQNIQENNPIVVSLYPNPANFQFTIQSTSEIQSIQLMDIEGRVLIGKVVGAKNFVLPVNNLAKGVYLVNVLAEGNAVVKKLVVE